MTHVRLKPTLLEISGKLEKTARDRKFLHTSFSYNYNLHLSLGKTFGVLDLHQPKMLALSSTDWLSPNQEAVVSAEMMGLKVYERES